MATKVSGLRNLGNTCFFNSVLQCLAQTPFLVKILDDLQAPDQKFVLPGGKYKANENEEEIELAPIEGILEKIGWFTEVLSKTLKLMQNSNGQDSLNPRDLFSAYRKKTVHCIDGGQHDSHELLRTLLEIIRNEDLRRYQAVILKEVGLSGKTKPDCVESNIKSQVKFYGSQASARLLGAEPVFRGVLVSTLECLDCHHISQRTEAFLDLSLPIMADKPQPPVMKRKNSGYGDIFDLMGNSISSPPSKHQLKKERKAARKNRKNRQHNHINTSNSHNQSNTEDNNGSVQKSEESDADIEDNIEVEDPAPEMGESGYGSEKASIVESPTSSAKIVINLTDLVSVQRNNEDNCLSISANWPPSEQRDSTEVFVGDTTQRRLSSETDRIWNSGSPENEEARTRLSLSGSLDVNSDVTSPDMPTMSSFSNSEASKGSPCSPVMTSFIGPLLPESGFSLLNSTEKQLNNKENYEGNNVDNEQGSPDSEKTRKDHECNGLSDITSGLSRLGIAGNANQSPTRYSTNEGERSVQSCLNQFTALELMSGCNKVGCESCTKKEKKSKDTPIKTVCTPHTKQYLISQVPAVLILHLKRFQAQRDCFRKVTKHVKFPLMLDLSPVCKGYKHPRIYSLYGVIAHSGTLHAGHYVAYIKSRQPLTPDDPRWSFLPAMDEKETAERSSSSSSDSEDETTATNSIEPPPGKWYYASDCWVSEVDEESVLEKQAYMLFYERIL
ncbi:ubiquitin carboxyl-terminal hydrolase 16/45 [Prorops nasuta]|uniref:ubiquitin carboxyl-terminal hydrolase 16/45 n=1 Tax=Prorops nasuta TaxID=863751 RepID=UPI0034CE3DE9